MIPGVKFGRLKAFCQVFDVEGGDDERWICVCSCGATRTETEEYINDEKLNRLGCRTCEKDFQPRGG
jgi:hypothetical protein